MSKVVDREFIDAVAVELGIPAALVEKDWYVVQVLRVIAEHTGLASHVPVFGGGTSLSKGFGIIKRLSEDIDFKVTLPNAPSKSAGQKGFSACRMAILDALREHGLTWTDENLLVGRGSAFFQVLMVYPREFEMPPGFRPELKVEMMFEQPRRAVINRPISSFVALGMGQNPEVASIACVDPLEIATDKVSAFLWRAKKMMDQAKQPPAEGEEAKKRDGTLVRHLHDLAALQPQIAGEPDFAVGVRALLDKDISRAKADEGLASIVEEVSQSLKTDTIWRTEFDSFVRHLSYAADDERIVYDEALTCWLRLIQQVVDVANVPTQ
ncbi:nucleotidyl transferase AbiEii/AbiGii toxin family protein [Azospirillum argentinense]